VSVFVCVCGGGFGARRGLIRLQGELKREDKSPSKIKKHTKCPMKQFLHFCIPSSGIIGEQRGIDSRSNEHDRHSNSIITTITIKISLNELYLHFRPGLGLSVLTFMLMCRITAQRTISESKNIHANTQIDDKSINFEINCTNKHVV